MSQNVLVLNNRQLTHTSSQAQYDAAPPNRKPNVTWSEVPPKSNGLFYGARATFVWNLVKMGLVVFA